MRPEYNGVKFYSDMDLSLGHYFEEARVILDNVDIAKDYRDINEIIELFNVNRIVRSKGIREDLTEPYVEKANAVMPVVGRFFKTINDDTFLECYRSVSIGYIEDFWILFNKFKSFEQVSEVTFKKMLQEPDTILYRILQNSGVVTHYDSLIADYMRVSDQTAELIMSRFLERRDASSSTTLCFPKALKKSEYEQILDQYIDSDHPNVGRLQLLATSQSSAECPISDEIRLKAKRKAGEIWEKQFSSGNFFSYGVGVGFKDTEELVSVEITEPNHYQITYDKSWITENLDHATLLNNFIYIFEFTDLHFRCSFPAVHSQMSTLERTLGIKGVREYETGTAFRVKDMKSSADMHGYRALLKDAGIEIEEVFHWFFTTYLRDEFNASGFVYNAPTKGQSLLEKCRNIPSEIDGVLKQYSLFAKNGFIDRELLEISSKNIVFEALPSMISNKYAYANSKEIKREQYLLFSDQCMLHYFPKQNREYNSFWEAAKSQDIKLGDYQEWMIEELKWLESRGTIHISSEGIIINKSRSDLLRDLYCHDVICPTYYGNKKEIESMVITRDLKYGDSLFSEPEQHYLNYILNKSEYSNGLDLRNKYIHSTYSLDEQRQERDYIMLLKIMAVIIIKINEEFCLKSANDNLMEERV